ncbi:MAG TPA: hypothetical protein V6C72_03350, partial [Chroococcales cyanobacterium]
MAPQPNQIRIGDLLMAAGILSSEYIKEALHNFEKRGLPIGKVLVLSGYLTEAQLRTALEVQSLLNDGLVPLEIATSVLSLSHQRGLSLAEAFQESGFVQPEDQQTNKLGQLLVSAGVVSNQQLDESLKTNVRTGLPLGHIFCFSGLASQHLVETALLAQNLIRRGLIERQAAIAGITAAHIREIRLEQNEVNRGFQRLPMKPSMKLGELLLKARMLTELQLEDALKTSLADGKFLGVILVESRIVTLDIVGAAIELQELLDNGTFDVDLAPEVLMAMRTQNKSLARAVGEAGCFKDRWNKAKLLIEMLTTCGAVTLTKLPQEIQQKVAVNYNQAAEVSRLLLEHQLVDEATLCAGLRSVYLVDNKILTMQQAIMALDFARKTGMTVDEAMYQLGWT